MTEETIVTDQQEPTESGNETVLTDQEPSTPNTQQEAVEETPKETEPKTEETTEEPKAPESYELKLAEDSPLDKGHIEKIADYAKKQGLSEDQAQTMLEGQEQAVREYAKAQLDQIPKVSDQWLLDSKADKEIGGDNFNESVESAKRVIDRFATDKLKQALNETGMGNNPEVIRMLSRIGKVMSDDTLVTASARQEEKSLEQHLYGGS